MGDLPYRLRGLSESDIFHIFAGIYDDYATWAAKRVPNYEPLGMDIVRFRKCLWSRHTINRSQFQAMLQRLRNDPTFRQYIHLYGGPDYGKANWVTCDEKRWLLIEVMTPRHIRMMMDHGGNYLPDPPRSQPQ